MKSPLLRIRQGACFLALISVVSICGYKLLSHRPWIEAIYWFVITVSSVGYAEVSQIDKPTQIFSVFVIVFGMSAAIYTIGGFLQMMTEGEIERALGVHRNRREISRLKDHVIICGYGRIGQYLAKDLRTENQPLVIIDNNQEHVDEAHNEGLLTEYGDATEESVLLEAGVERARSLISVLPSDADNVFITLTSRNLSRSLQIIARAEQPSSEKKLLQAGADRVVLTAAMGARRMARMIMRPHTAELIDQVADNTSLDVELDEFHIPADSSLVGKSVRDTEAHRTHKLLVVFVARAGGEMIFNPHADHVFAVGDTIVVMGHKSDIDKFRIVFNV